MDYLRIALSKSYVLEFRSSSSRPKRRNVTGKKSKINGREEAIVAAGARLARKKSRFHVKRRKSLPRAACFFVDSPLRKDL